MSNVVLEQEVLKLSAREKAHMIDALWQSLDPEEQTSIDRAWLAESRDRLNAFHGSELKPVDGESTLRDLEAELR